MQPAAGRPRVPSRPRSARAERHVAQRRRVGGGVVEREAAEAPWCDGPITITRGRSLPGCSVAIGRAGRRPGVVPAGVRHHQRHRLRRQRLDGARRRASALARLRPGRARPSGYQVPASAAVAPAEVAAPRCRGAAPSPVGRGRSGASVTGAPVNARTMRRRPLLIAASRPTLPSVNAAAGVARLADAGDADRGLLADRALVSQMPQPTHSPGRPAAAAACTARAVARRARPPPRARSPWGRSGTSPRRRCTACAIAHGRQRPRSTNAVPMRTGGPAVVAGSCAPASSGAIAPVGQTSPQRVQASSHQPRRGTSTGVQNPSTPAWRDAGWSAPVGQACWHSAALDAAGEELVLGERARRPDQRRARARRGRRRRRAAAGRPRAPPTRAADQVAARQVGHGRRRRQRRQRSRSAIAPSGQPAGS